MTKTYKLEGSVAVPRRQRVVVRKLYYEDQDSLADISQKTGFNEASIRSVLIDSVRGDWALVEKRREATRLRLQERLRNYEIGEKVGLNYKRLNKWLVQFPLDPAEMPRCMVRRRDDYQKALQFRQEGLSYKEIGEMLGVGKSLLNYWLADVVIDEDARQKLAQKKDAGGVLGRKNAEEMFTERRDSILAKMHNRIDIQRPRLFEGIDDKVHVGRRSEAYVRNVLVEMGFEIYCPDFDCQICDLVAISPDAGNPIRVQIKTLREADSGLPYIGTRRSYEGSPYSSKDTDIVIGVDQFTGNCFMMVPGKTPTLVVGDERGPTLD